MTDKRKFSLFISSTYEDLKEERQALVGVALENGFIPVGMEQFHGAPADQWTVITKIIDECDFYLLVVGGRYGSLDEAVNKSFTEKEYDYAKGKGRPVLVLVKEPSSITEDKKDSGDNKYVLWQRLEDFRKKVKSDSNTVAFFSDLNELKYEAAQTLKNAIDYADGNSGWVRYKDILEVINEEAAERSKANATSSELYQKKLEEMKEMLTGFGNRLTDIEKHKISWEEMPIATKQDVENLIRVEGNRLIIGGDVNPSSAMALNDDVGNIPVDAAFLLVYAADGNGQIMKIQTLDSFIQVSAAGKQFMADNSQRESARWVEALDCLVNRKLVKPVGYKRQIYEVTVTGYSTAVRLKEELRIDTTEEPLVRLQEISG